MKRNLETYGMKFSNKGYGFERGFKVLVEKTYNILMTTWESES